MEKAREQAAGERDGASAEPAEHDPADDRVTS